MKTIKTIMVKADYPGEFDDRVNAALRDGWKLVRRDVLPAYEGKNMIFYRMFYAELERVIVEEVPRDCRTCAHVDTFASSYPCCDCNNEDKWEAKE